MNGFITGAFLAYSVSFLELYPHYECSTDMGETWKPCKNTDFCNKPEVKWRINFDYPDSLHNWVESLDLHCVPKSQIGLIGSMFFAGWFIAATFLPRLSDLYGRRRVYLISMIGHAIFYGLIIISQNIKMTTAM